MSYTQLKLKPAYREKLKALADAENRSMANMVEALIDRASSSDITQLLADERNRTIDTMVSTVVAWEVAYKISRFRVPIYELMAAISRLRPKV